MFAILLYLRYGVHARGRQVALLTIVAFALLLFTLACLATLAGREARHDPPGRRLQLPQHAGRAARAPRLRRHPRPPRALAELGSRYGCEAVILSTCNRVELYLAPGRGCAWPRDADADRRVPGRSSRLSRAETCGRTCTSTANDEAVRHLFRVAASLDSLIVGEGQIAGQVKRAYELAQAARPRRARCCTPCSSTPASVAKRVRTETGIARGHVSVSSVAVDYVRQVFDHFDDKTVLVIGAGKMGELTLKHLRGLQPRAILVTNRSPEKAETVAQGCGGEAGAVGEARRRAGARPTSC